MWHLFNGTCFCRVLVAPVLCVLHQNAIMLCVTPGVFSGVGGVWTGFGGVYDEVLTLLCGGRDGLVHAPHMPLFIKMHDGYLFPRMHWEESQ